MQLSRFAALAGLVAAASAQKVKVSECCHSPAGLFQLLILLAVLLGDSITEITCWRPLVWSQLVTAGLASNVDFVGSQHSIPATCSKPAGFDQDHEGHSGWQAYDIARNNIVGWVQNTKPDVVQFMLGTNDVNIGKHNVSAVVDAYTTMLKAMRAANPKVKVIVGLSC